MNIFYGIYRTDNGAVVSSGMTSEILLPTITPGAGQAMFLGEIDTSDLVDLVTGQRIIGGNRAPEEPFGYAENNGLWVANLQGKKDVKKVDITAEREARIFAPINYDGRTYDTLMRSLNSMSQKLDELDYLQDGQEYPGLLEWRDATNEYKTFTSIAEMRTWLLGLRAAIARRRTEAYRWSWQRKDDLNGLNTIEQVQAFVP